MSTLQGRQLGIAWHEPVRAATVVAGTLASSFSNGDTIDGVVLATGDRILIKDQAAPAENGLYRVEAAGAPTREKDGATGRLSTGASAFVAEGTTNGVSAWWLTTLDPITVGVTGQTWLLFAGGPAVASSSEGTAGVPLNDLQAYVDIGDRGSFPGSGTTVTDLQGNLTAGAFAGGPTYQDGVLQFDGVAGVLSFTKNAALDNVFSGGGAVMVFFRAFSDGQGNTGRLVDTAGLAGAGYALFVESELGDSLRLSFRRDFATTDGVWEADDRVAAVLRAADLDTWHSFAVVYDDTNVANDPLFYLDGVRIPLTETSTPLGAPVSDVGNDLLVGNSAAGTLTFDGQFDVLQVYDALAEAEVIAQAHNAFFPRHGGLAGAPGDGVIGGSDVTISAGDYYGTGVEAGGTLRLRGGFTSSASNSSSGGPVDIRGGDSDLNGAGPVGSVTCAGGTGDQELAKTVGSITTIGSEFGGATITSGSSGITTLFRGSDNSDTGSGGPTVVRGGDALAVGSGNDNGGAVGLVAGQQRNGGLPGRVFVRSMGPSVGTTSITGDVVITTQTTDPGFLGPQGGSFTDSGNISIRTGPNQADASSSGDIEMLCGDVAAGGANLPGGITLAAGSINETSQSNSAGGSFSISAGSTNGNNTAPGGPLTLSAGDQTGTGTGSNSPGGPVLINAGSSSQNTPSSPGGPIDLNAGDGSSASAPAGPATLKAGDQTGVASTAPGGEATLRAGDVTDAGSSGDAGDAVLRAGIASGTGLDGVVRCEGDLSMQGGGHRATVVSLTTGTTDMDAFESFFVDTTANPVTLNLPPAIQRKTWRLIITASVQTTTIVPDGTDTVNGVASNLLLSAVGLYFVTQDGGIDTRVHGPVPQA